jgi:hypothetical protein
MEGMAQKCPGGTEKHAKSPRHDGVSTDIRIDHLMDTCLDRYRYESLLYETYIESVVVFLASFLLRSSHV